jgi:hypothetical protein
MEAKICRCVSSKQGYFNGLVGIWPIAASGPGADLEIPFPASFFPVLHPATSIIALVKRTLVQGMERTFMILNLDV